MAIVRDCMFQNLATLSPGASLMETVRRMVRQKPGFAVVLDDMRPVGLVTEYDLLKWLVQGRDPHKTQLKDLSLSVPHTIYEDTPCQELLAVYNHRRIRRFPVLNSENILVGGVMERQVVASLPRSELLSHYRVMDVAMGNPPVVAPGLTYAEGAAKVVELHRGGCLVVAEGEHLVGLVTEGDFLRARVRPDWTPDLPVASFFKPNPITIGPDLDLNEALDFFLKVGHRRLPIVDGQGVLRGLLTQTDILRRATHAVRAHEAILNPEDIAQPAVWVDPKGENRIQAMNERGARALDLVPGQWVGRSARELVADRELWPAIAVVLTSCGSFGPVNLTVRTGGGSPACVPCRFSLIHTPAGEDRIFWTMGELERDRGGCK